MTRNQPPGWEIEIFGSYGRKTVVHGSELWVVRRRGTDGTFCIRPTNIREDLLARVSGSAVWAEVRYGRISIGADKAVELFLSGMLTPDHLQRVWRGDNLFVVANFITTTTTSFDLYITPVQQEVYCGPL